MTILEHISKMKLDADGGELVGWTDAGTIERGCGYVDRVKEIASAYNLLAGVVDGTTRYYTNVRIEVNGFLDAICSCPVGKRCKHSVAMILKARQMMLDREQIPSTIPAEWTSRPEKRIREIERKIEEQWRQQKLEEDQRVAQQVHEEECEREREDAFWRDYTAVREAVLASCRNDSAEKIKAAAETFLEWAGDDELYEHPQLNQRVWDAVDPTMAAVIETFEANGVDPADTITWAYELDAPDRCLSVGNRLKALRSSPRIKTTSPETLPWPLPWANEGMRLFDSRWQDSNGTCQQDMEFLLKLALVSGDKVEIARRFDDLPETPNNGGMPLESAKAEMCESVMAAMKGYRDDIVARLAKLRKYCYVKEDRDGVECAVRVFRELGETSDNTFPDWPSAMYSRK